VERNNQKNELLQALGHLVLSLLIGAVGGLVGVAFDRSITAINTLRAGHPWMVWCLPVAGVVIVALYKLSDSIPIAV